MYNPYDENNMGAANNTGEPMEQDTEKKENESAESAAQEPASVESSEYHYTGSQVKDRDSQASTPYGGQGSHNPYPTQSGWQYGNQPQQPRPTRGTALPSSTMSLITHRRSRPSRRSPGTAKR